MARTNIVTTSPPLADFTDEQFEEMLSKRRLEKEKNLLQQASTSTTAGVKTVMASNCTANAVGLSPCLNVEIARGSISHGVSRHGIKVHNNLL